MLPCSHFPGLRQVLNASFARVHAASGGLALLPLCLTLLAPSVVRADIYKWTDAQGNIVISNVQPVGTSKVSDVELLATAARPAGQLPAAAAPPAATPAEQALEARIENLERQLQEQQAPLDPQANYPGGYVPAPVAPPPDPGNYAGYDPANYPGYDPAYYPGYSPGFYNPWPPSYFVIVAPARVRRPAFVNRPVIRNRPPVFTGRAPVFTGRAPVFTGRAPVFTSRAPAFTGRTAFASARTGSIGGGTMHGGRR